MKYDFTSELVKERVRAAFNLLYSKLNVISSVFVTTDIVCADIRFKWVLDDLTAIKATEAFDILKAYHDYRYIVYHGPTFMDVFSDEMFATLKAGPKKINDIVTVWKYLDSSMNAVTMMLNKI